MNPQDQNTGQNNYPSNQNGSPLPVDPAVPPTSNVVQIPGANSPFTTANQPLPPEQQAKVDYSPYEFIMSPQKSKKTNLTMNNSSPKKRVMVIAGGIILLLIIGSTISSIINSNNHKSPTLLAVQQEQTELIRVATVGASISTTPSTRALAYNIQLCITSENVQLSTYTTTNKLKIDPKLLGLKHSTAVDSQLLAAQSNNDYDSTLIGILKNDLANYSTALKLAYKADPGPKGRQLLSADFDAAQLLIQQSGDNDQ